MLDDLKYIHQKDAGDALGIAEKQWQQVNQEFELIPKPAPGQLFHVVLSGMGGSSLAAELFKGWQSINVPFEIVKDYHVPNYVDADTLFIASSYSGNTEETLSALSEAVQKHAHIVIISAGGKLIQQAKEEGYTHVELPSGLQPRHATFYGLKALAVVLDEFGVTNGRAQELTGCSKHLKDSAAQWGPSIPTDKNLAKQIALDVVGKSPVVYGGPLLASAAYKWKISFNENAKNVAWCNKYPEFNHNEFLGWSSHPIDKPYAVINLRSSFDSPSIQKRFDVSKRLLSGRMPEPIEIEAKGQTELEQLLYTVVLGDFVSIYLGLLNGLNPTPVDLIEKLKAELT